MDDNTDEDADKLINEVEEKFVGGGGGGVTFFVFIIFLGAISVIIITK